jgi:hypothetical protein
MALEPLLVLGAARSAILLASISGLGLYGATVGFEPEQVRPYVREPEAADGAVEHL